MRRIQAMRTLSAPRDSADRGSGRPPERMRRPEEALRHSHMVDMQVIVRASPR